MRRLAVRVAGAGLVYLCTAAAQSVPGGLAGDPAAGLALFAGEGGCLPCHSSDGRSLGLGPDLEWIGLLRTPESLRQSLLDDAAHKQARRGFSANEIEHLVAYLRTRRSLPPSEPRERTRSIAPVSENAAFFDRPGRDAEERSDALVRALDIREGARVADLGAGTGYFTWRLARQAGPEGRIIAVDIQQPMLDAAAATVKQHGLLNVDYVLADDGDPKLPPRSLDLVFIAHSYHEFSQPESILEAVRRSLKPGGRLVIVEYAKERRMAPASSLHKMSFDEMRSEIEPAGFELERVLDFLPVQHGLIFTVR